MKWGRELHLPSKRMETSPVVVVAWTDGLLFGVDVGGLSRAGGKGRTRAGGGESGMELEQEGLGPEKTRWDCATCGRARADQGEDFAHVQRQRKSESILGRYWVRADRKTDIDLFSSTRWAMIFI